jgi:hypothetical protein
MLETDPRDLALDEHNDLIITTDLDWSRGIEGVMQECRIKLQMFQGEWFLNLDVGIPYWTHILGQKPAIAIAAMGAAFSETLIRVEDVIEVTKMNITHDRALRKLVVNWQVRTKFGTTPTDTLAIAA